MYKYKRKHNYKLKYKHKYKEKYKHKPFTEAFRLVKSILVIQNYLILSCAIEQWTEFTPTKNA